MCTADLESFVLKGGEEEDGDGCASSGTEESPVQGVGNHGCEGDNGKKKPYRHLPGEKDLPVCDKDEDKEGDQDSCSQKKMDLDISQHNLLSSPGINSNSASIAPKDNVKEDDQEGCSQEKLEVENTEQCHGPSGGIEPSTALAKFSPSDLQHGCYCSNPSCSNVKCSFVKAEVEHMKTHEDWVQCSRCKCTRALVAQHAETCRLHGCRIPLCYSIRKGYGDKGNIAKAKPFEAPLVPVPMVHEALMYSTFPQWVPWFDLNHVNGKVIFRNTNLIPEDYFLEDTDYCVDKKACGKGSSGQVYCGYLLSDRRKKMAVKKTTYSIKKEEVEVYKLLGDHKHIVKHLGGTFQGTQGHACIFMEPCDDSLYNYMKNTLKRRLSVKEAMLYWLQIREAVDHLHDWGIIHKDIKAKNVLMKEGRVLLADFDCAMRLVNEVTEKGLAPRGTKGFVSPEVLARKPHGRPADIYNMGCFLIEMTIGPPVDNTLNEKIEMLRKLDSELAVLVEACVSKRPEHRPTTRSLLDWPVVKRYIAAGKAEVGRKENTYHWSQVQETSTTEDQTATLRTLENRAGENDLRRICELERIEAREL